MLRTCFKKPISRYRKNGLSTKYPSKDFKKFRFDLHAETTLRKHKLGQKGAVFEIFKPFKSKHPYAFPSFQILEAVH